MNRLFFKLVLLAFPLVSNMVVAGEESVIEFNGVAYQLLVSASDARDFFPVDQESDKWVERVSFASLSGASDGIFEDAANKLISSRAANTVSVIRNYPVEGSSASGEYLLVWVEKGESFLEFSAHRFLKIDGQMSAMSYSRREYGTGVGPTLSRWMQENGEALENALVSVPVATIAQRL